MQAHMQACVRAHCMRVPSRNLGTQGRVLGLVRQRVLPNLCLARNRQWTAAVESVTSPLTALPLQCDSLPAAAWLRGLLWRC